MNETNLQILVKLKDEASAEFKKVGDNIATTSSRMKSSIGILNTDVTGLSKTILGAGVAAGGLAIAFGVQTVKAASDAQVAISRVDAVLKVMGKSALANRQALLEAADAAVKLGFDDEDAAESIAKFYQRTNDLTQAQKLNNLAMDLARAKHLDLSQAANLVNMALSGQGRVLSQYGISIKETASPLEALMELQKQVSGQAQAFSETFQGQMQVLSVNFQNIKEQIGSVLIEALTPFVLQFTAWLNDPETKKNFAKWTADFKSWAEVIIPVIIDTFKMWFSWAEKVYNMIISIGDAITSMYNKAKQVTAGSSNPFEAIGRLGGAVGASAIRAVVPGRAVGGPVSSGNPYIVGERGPELFLPSSSGTIIPNGGGVGAATVNISIGNLYGTDERAALRFADTIADILGQQLKLRTI